MAGSIRVAGHTIAEHDIVNDKIDIKNATLDSTNTFNFANDSISGDKIDGGTISNATLASSVTFSSFVGLILPFAYDTSGSPPTGFFECDGSAISRTTYADLFSAIGTTWGVGDGSTTFNLPDLQGAFLRGTGSHGSSTMANTNAFAGPSVGSFENDQYQSHIHQFTGYSKGGSGNNFELTHSGSGTPRTMPSSVSYVDDAEVSSNGTPRKGDETRPFNAGVMYCIKY